MQSVLGKDAVLGKKEPDMINVTLYQGNKCLSVRGGGDSRYSIITATL